MSQKRSDRAISGGRQHPRFAIDGGLYVRDETVRATVEVRDISQGGFQTISPEPAARGSLHVFRFLRPQGTVTLRARAVHCRALVGDSRSFAIGWELESKLPVR
jgi:hypothetical protein